MPGYQGLHGFAGFGDGGYEAAFTGRVVCESIENGVSVTRKICMVVHQYPPDPGATAYRMEVRARHLIAQGYEVDVFAPGNPLDSGTVAPGLCIHRVSALGADDPSQLDYTRHEISGRGRSAAIFRPLSGFLRWLPALVSSLRRFDGQDAILYTYNNPVSLHLAGLFVRKRFRAWVCEFRDPITGYEYSARGFWGRLTDGWLQNQVLRHANVVCMRKGIQASPDAYGTAIGELVLLPDYGVDLELFSDFQPPGGAVDSPVGLYAGTVFSDMSFASLSSGLDQYHRSGGSVEIRLFGADHPEYHKYGNLAYGGNISFESLLGEYARAHFLIVYDLSECRYGKDAGFFPSKLAELIAARRPILLIGKPDSVAAQVVGQLNIGVCSANEPVAVSAAMSVIVSGIRSAAFELSMNDEKRSMIDMKIAENGFVKMLSGV